ncbi:MAG: lysine transporter LysE [Rickettsiales bacterium]|nr:lysine transporter LysE [Rickettsiales bacterium]|tara:strand:+ start:6340 stop:6966 length:627 start_codon:yes stop_codon:yes gene_type:complete
MELAVWLSIAAVCATGAASPGPSLAVVVRSTVIGGRSRGMLCGLGHGIGVGIYAFGAVVGVSAVVASNPGLARSIEVLGGCYLLWMAVQAARNSVAPASPPSEAREPGLAGFAEGFLVAFLNPKIAVFFLALLGSFLPVDASAAQRAGVAALAMCIDALWYMFVAAILAGTGAVRVLEEQGRWVERFMAVLLTAVAVWLLFGGPALRA